MNILQYPQRMMVRWLMLLGLIFGEVEAQEMIDLYPDEIPNAKETTLLNSEADSSGLIRRVIRPTLEVFLPEKGEATGAAVVICPGGGYAVLVYEAEGVRTAQ